MELIGRGSGLSYQAGYLAQRAQKLDFKLKKPKNWVIMCLIAIVACAVAVIVLFSRTRAVRLHPPVSGRLIDQLIGSDNE